MVCSPGCQLRALPLLMSAVDGVSAYDVLEKGLDDLMDLCDVVMDKFTFARDDFMQKQAS